DFVDEIGGNMNQFKIFAIFFICLGLMRCQQSPNGTHTEGIGTDSLSVVPADSMQKIDTPVGIKEAPLLVDESTDSTRIKLREGVHNLSLQWISWEEMGKAEIEHLEGNKYSIVGEQRNPGD